MRTEPQLFDYKPPLPDIHFKGESYDVIKDCKRLNAQQKRVRDVMLGAGWLTLREIAEKSNCPEASASARFRDFRNHDYLRQHYTAESRRRTASIWEYRLSERG